MGWNVDMGIWWTPMVVPTRNADLMLLPGKGPAGKTWRLVAVDPVETAEMWSQPLPAEPVRWGLAVSGAGHVVVTCRDGQVVCFARAPAPAPPAAAPPAAPGK
jgi:ABC-type uncharacterized transport system permease subunit